MIEIFKVNCYNDINIIYVQEDEMNFSAFNYGANAVCIMKNDKNYGMICAWSMQVDYDKVLLLIGAQSVTGQQIHKGDLIGVSALNEHQKDIVETLGSDHSNQVDKFKNIKTSLHETAILIDDASVIMVVEVLDIVKLDGVDEEDKLIYGLIKSHTVNDIKKFNL